MLAFSGGLTKGSDRRQCLWSDSRFVNCILPVPGKITCPREGAQRKSNAAGVIVAKHPVPPGGTRPK